MHQVTKDTLGEAELERVIVDGGGFYRAEPDAPLRPDAFVWKRAPKPIFTTVGGAR
jgi:hypothetical protein